MSAARTADDLGALLIAAVAELPFERLRDVVAVVDNEGRHPVSVREIPELIADYLGADLYQLVRPLRRLARPGELRVVVLSDTGAKVITLNFTRRRLEEARRAHPLAGITMSPAHRRA